MPHLTSASWTIWLIVILLQPALVILLIASGLWRKWTALFFFLLSKSITSFLLLGITLYIGDLDRQAALYFFTYWAGMAVASVMEIWMIVEIACALGGISPRTRKWIHIGVPVLAVINLAVCLTLSIQAPMAPFGRAVVTIFDLQKVISLGWLVTFLAVASASEIMGIEWSHGVRGIAIGYAIEAAGTTVVTWLIALFPAATELSEAKGIVYISALCVWAASIRKRKEEVEPIQSLQSLQSYSTTFIQTVERIRRSK